MTRLKFIGFAAAAVLLSGAIMSASLLAADVYLHHRAERSAGLNRWGYRGPVLGRKQAGEVRAAMLGGSTTFGYGVTWDEAIPAVLEGLSNAAHPDVRLHVANLGYNNEGAYALLPTLRDFEYLNADIVILYPGYNDLIGDDAPNLSVFRHESPVFRLTGYFPILPLALGEKALALRYGGDLGAAYDAARGGSPGKTVFRPNLANRTSAAAMEAATTLSESLSRQLNRVETEAPKAASTSGVAGCASPWIHFCDSVYLAVRHALDGGRVVIVVSPPSSPESASNPLPRQQRALTAMIAARFADTPRVRFVDVSQAVDLSDPDVSFDGMHLSVDGNRIVAKRLVEPVHAAAGLVRGTP